MLLRYLVITPHQVRYAFETTAAALEGRSGVDCTFSGSTAVLVLVTTKGASTGAKGGAKGGAHPKGSSGSSGSRREITVGFVGDSRAVLGRSGQAGGGGGGGGGGGRQRPAEVTAMVLTPTPNPNPTPTPTPTPDPNPTPTPNQVMTQSTQQAAATVKATTQAPVPLFSACLKRALG